MRRQLRTMGAAWDWSAEVVTCDPEYYRWNQWLFIQFLNAGLAYRAVSPVDWCPNDGTLAREQVEGADRHCWRCGAKVEKRELAQWYLRTTSYADELLDFSGIDWPDPIRIMQTNWIGRSTGAEVVFETAPSPHHAGGEELRVFTTRPDTLFGATFMVLAPEHPLVATLTAPDRREEVDAYVAATTAKTEIDRLSTDREKTGVPIGADAINPVNGERIPIFVADYVLGGYGTGAIMAVPAHDERDFAFAKKFGLPIVNVVMPKGADPSRGARDGLRRAHRRRGHGQLGPVHRSPGLRGLARDRRLAGGERQGLDGGHLPPARLARQPPALLGHPDPGHPLRAVRGRAGARGPAAGAAAGHRRLPGQRREPAEPRRGVPQRRVPVVRRAGAARVGHAGHVRRLVVVLVPLPVAAQGRRAGRRRHGRALDARPAVHRRRRARRDAPAVQPVLDQGDARRRPRAGGRAVQAAVQPGPDPGRRRRADEQEPGQRPGPGRARRALRRGHRAPVPDVHGAVGPGRAVEPERHRRRPQVPQPRLGDRARPARARRRRPDGRRAARRRDRARRAVAHALRGAPHAPRRHRGLRGLPLEHDGRQAHGARRTSSGATAARRSPGCPSGTRPSGCCC